MIDSKEPSSSHSSSSRDDQKQHLPYVKMGRMQRKLELDQFCRIFSWFDGHSIARMSHVSKFWNTYVKDPLVWRQCCTHLWKDDRNLEREMARAYQNSWLKMYKTKPHVRMDGIYVLEKSFFKAGGEGLVRAPKVIKISYFRTLQFFPNGVVRYGLLNKPPKGSWHKPIVMLREDSKGCGSDDEASSSNFNSSNKAELKDSGDFLSQDSADQLSSSLSEMSVSQQQQGQQDTTLIQHLGRRARARLNREQKQNKARANRVASKPINSDTVRRQLKWGTYIMRGSEIVVDVDMGHIRSYLYLKYASTCPGSFNALKMKGLRGRVPGSNKTQTFPTPNALFELFVTHWK